MDKYYKAEDVRKALIECIDALEEETETNIIDRGYYGDVSGYVDAVLSNLDNFEWVKNIC